MDSSSKLEWYKVTFVDGSSKGVSLRSGQHQTNTLLMTITHNDRWVCVIIKHTSVNCKPILNESECMSVLDKLL